MAPLKNCRSVIQISEMSSHRVSDVVEAFLLVVRLFSGRVVDPPELDLE